MKTLTELKAENLPTATFETIGLKDNGSDLKALAEAIAAVNEYGKGFLPPHNECVMCGTVQGGFGASLLGTGFVYGIAHGEGSCGTCGYPARTVHHIEGLGTLSNLILQYHPNVLRDRGEEETPNG